jgi:alpha-beta hydrolase superfamily lysophospholipase
MRFAEAVAVVTGASRGIGRATAGLLAAEGATVVAAAQNGNRLEELAGEASGTVQPVACDVAVPTDVARLFRVAADAGGCSIPVAAAGVLFKRPIEDTADDRWSETIAVNLTGAFLCSRAAFGRLRARGGGRIVLVSGNDACRARMVAVGRMGCTAAVSRLRSGACTRRRPTRRRTMPTQSKRPDTIVLVHGFWVTPRSWEHWITRYEAQGYRVLAPAYPGFEVEVEALNRDPSPVERLTVPAIMAHLEVVVGRFEAPPILMGHSAGGAFVQLLLDRGYGAVGVAINSAPTEGVRVTPLSQLKSTFPVLKNPANRHRAVGFTYDQWRYVFTNTFDEADARAAYDRYHVPASGGIFWDSVLANFIPGPQDIAVDYHNDARAPLLFISGSEDHLMPPAVQCSNAKHYKSNTITEITEFPGRSHLMAAQQGWEEIADYALAWAEEHGAHQRQAAPASS